ncbi:aspartyl/glutamyl-tRNA(Asn/Gln) amidotransferase subunit B [Holospora obtusa F1]|uniref:Aspartyl/glutamyl-tRNA(Asn/Gln) amidotransferase subunit B n=1 Tax=Holospora obtusa F1 TaxID=1399147 RepID=W6TVB5_HOLOB|nr:Asp-tRNA(Asn)/Glu-tRNA(Gln) amidotransferase subunit GatB [Holospora obtusa]ETZ07727.1 aspartyl/glutamyl-tRNA(Asn/Gln) amidotransferase subunit B [Holospora obtusa F1]
MAVVTPSFVPQSNSISYTSGLGNVFYVYIGLEIHLQIKSARKIFSFAPVDTQTLLANHCVDFVDVAFPGMLPVLNRASVEQGIRMGLALNGSVNAYCVFDRKHYFYPDNPSGYQISQQRYPLIEGGEVSIVMEESLFSPRYEKMIRIHRLHLEQDAGKSLHDAHSESLIDFNRAGVGLMEVVSFCDLSSPEEAAVYVDHIQRIARYTKTSDADMEKGQMRFDVNVSVSPQSGVLGTRVEIKNMNSIRFLKAALNYEISRQIECLEQKKEFIQETRGFDEKLGITFSMRSKEEAQDYRYFPDPDLPTVCIEKDWVEKIFKTLPELFDVRRKRFIQTFQLSEYDSFVLTEISEVADFFEETLSFIPESLLENKKSVLSKAVCNWITGPLFSKISHKEKLKEEIKFSSHQFANFIVCVIEKNIPTPIAKELFQEMLDHGKNVEDILQEKNIDVQGHSQEELMKIICEVHLENLQQIKSYLSGKEKLFMFFLGQTMKKLKGRGNPEQLQDLWKNYLQTLSLEKDFLN